MLRSFLILFCACATLAGTRTFAQDGRDLSEEARKQYAQCLREASAMVKDRQFANAHVKLDVLLTQRPREPQARFLKGVVQTEQGQDAAAIATFSALIEDIRARAVQQPRALYAQKGNEGARVARVRRQDAPDWAIARARATSTAARRYATASKLDRANKTAAAKLTLARELIAPTPKPAATTAVTPKP
jgi:hypothetical protein